MFPSCHYTPKQLEVRKQLRYDVVPANLAKLITLHQWQKLTGKELAEVVASAVKTTFIAKTDDNKNQAAIDYLWLHFASELREAYKEIDLTTQRVSSIIADC